MNAIKNQALKVSLAGLVAVALLCAALPRANAATTVASWNFTGTWTTGTSPTIAGTPGAFVSGASMTTLITDSGIGTPSIARQGTGGQSGAYMRFTDNLFATSYPARFTLTLTSSANMSSFSITYYARSSTTTMATDTWSYSINGGAFTDFATQTIASGTTWNQYTVTPSASIAVLSGQTIAFRNTLSGGTAGNVTADFDTITVTAVPEPVNVALGMFGAGFAVVGLGRCYLNRKTAIKSV
jgi:hypothetical protein